MPHYGDSDNLEPGILSKNKEFERNIRDQKVIAIISIQVFENIIRKCGQVEENLRHLMTCSALRNDSFLLTNEVKTSIVNVINTAKISHVGKTYFLVSPTRRFLIHRSSCLNC